jgi:S-adenosylmethionine hydrolase
MPERTPVVTLTSDFGTADPFVACMKGVILGLHPAIRIVDIGHDIPPHDIVDGAFKLRCAFPYFPTGTVHVAVVDPGVGSARRPLVMVTENYRFLAPDNGILSLVPEVEEVRAVYHVSADHYFRTPLSATFHGRDLFAPVAAWLCRGIDPAQLGEPIDDWHRLELPRTRLTEDGKARGIVWSVDRFGNVVTGLSRTTLDTLAAKHPAGLVLTAATQRIGRLVQAYHEIAAEEAAYLVNSFGMIEIAMSRRSAAKALGLKRGDPVELAPATGSVP